MSTEGNLTTNSEERQPKRRAGTSRGRTGCITCRNRKKKCDGAYPICEQCRRLNYSCLREDPRPPIPPKFHTWKTPPRPVVTSELQRRSPHHVEDIAIIRSPDPIVLWENQPGNQEVASNRRLVLRYYIDTFSGLMTTNLENNSFLSVFLPMAMDSPVLLNAIVACSSSHLALRDESYTHVALQLRSASFKSLSSSLASQRRSPDLELASCLVLCAMESILGDTSQWYHHLAGAFEVMRSAGVLQVDRNGMFVPSGFLNTSDGRWLLRNFAYHDVMMSVTLERKPFMPGEYWASQGESLVDSYYGLASHIIFLISEISILSADMAISAVSGNTDSFSFPETAKSNKDEQSSKDGCIELVQRSNPLQDFSTRAHLLEAQLLAWTCAPSQNPSLVAQAEAYRGAALIHLYRALRLHVPSLAEMLDRKIARQVQNMVDCFEQMPAGCLPECTLLFPLFMAGGEARDVNHVRFIRQRMLDILESRRFQNVRTALIVLDELWRLRAGVKEGPGNRNVDWRDVLKRRGWKLALS